LTGSNPFAGESSLPSPTTLRLIQISDCHVSADDNTLYRGQNAEENFKRVLHRAGLWSPDLILLSGDVSEDGSEESYQRTSGLLAATGVPVLALPGNHDDVEVMSRYFRLGPWDGPFVTERDNWQLVLLDCTEPGRISGSFSTSTLEKLKTGLQNSEREYSLVALHHQPVPVGAFWIDRYKLESPSEFLQVIDHSPRVRCISWGHVHQDFRVQRNEVSLLGAPSSVANSIPGTQSFTLDPAGPACRWLELTVTGEVKTGLLYV
jgi:Icc protein